MNIIAEMAVRSEREKKIKEIMAKIPRDYKDTKKRGVMPPFNVYNTTTIVYLDKIDDEELEKVYQAVVKKR